jgi:5-deoxy-glucuronate isomerase
MSRYLIRPTAGQQTIDVEPRNIGWGHLGFEVVTLAPGDRLELDTAGRETAIIPMAGSGVAETSDGSFELLRRGIFEEAGSLLYLPPGCTARLVANTDWVVATGSAPAEGLLPTRLITPDEARTEVRGGGAARRQVNHLLAPPLPAERLIVYEVYVPAGSWAGWPPHCHDGAHRSPYLEETYYFRFDRPEGFAFHRNYVDDGSYDETFAVRDGDCVAVPRGFHVTTPAPGANAWILNFLAGELVGNERATPPYFDPSTVWITEDWSKGQMQLPAHEVLEEAST